MDSPYLALEELKALAEPEEVHYVSGVALFEGGKVEALSKASYVKRSGQVIAITNDLNEVSNELNGECFHLRVDSIMASDKNRVQAELSKLGRRIKLSKNCPVLDVLFTEGMIILGLQRAERDTKSLERHSNKPFKQSGTLSSDLARVIVNLSKPKRVLYDPFAGLGSVLIEAAWEGLYCVGSDIDHKSIHKAKVNLSALGYHCDLFVGDATQKNLYEVEAIATDPPYGRSVRARASELMDLYRAFIWRSAEALRSKGRLVFITDSRYWFYDDFKEAGFNVLSMSKVYEHKSLTRTIYVAERP